MIAIIATVWRWREPVAAPEARGERHQRNGDRPAAPEGSIRVIKVGFSVLLR
jgi:hypothetical protein